MNTQDSQSRLLLTFGASLMAASLPLTSTNCAYANSDRAAARFHNTDFRDSLRAARHENRDFRREQRIENRAAIQQTLVPTTNSGNIVNVDPVRTHIQRGNTAILFPGQVSTFRTSRPHNLSNSTFTNEAGRSKNIERGVNLDLSSTNANITVGSSLIGGSTTIQVGDQTKTVSAGTKLTAAEYAALNQKLATGSQSLHLNSNGAADSGNLNLNLISDDGSTIRASQLVVPQNVTVSGDFARTADGVHVTKDIVNYGSLLATSSDANKNTAIIGARDINNEHGATIASLASATNPQLNLSLRADRDLNNDGSITAAGNLELFAGNTINNHGSATATNGDITLATAPDAVLLVNSYDGTLSATNGAINIREAGYAGTADSNVYGGNFYSKELNVNAGQGTANLRVNDVTGAVNSYGAAVHVSANTSELVLGTQCLTGDPTYFNNGNIVLAGDITVDEDLAIIAGGDITTTKTGLTIRTRGASNVGHDINIIAGANITAGSGQTTNPLPAQSTGSISGNATAPVTVSGASVTGGNVDFTGATGSLFIDAATNLTNGNGANVTIAAFAGSGGGSILTNNGVSHQISAQGNGIGNNGNVSLIAGAVSGQAIQIGAIHTAGSSGTAVGTGDILIANAQPTTSDSNPITFGTNGSITSGNKIVASSTVGGGSVNAASTPGASLDTRQNLTVISGSTTFVGAVSSLYTTIKVVSGGNLTVNTMFHNQGGQVELLAQGNITILDSIRADNGILIVAGGDLITGGGSGSPAILSNKTGDTGNISVIAGASFVETGGGVQINGASATGGSILFNVGQQIQNLRASSSGGNGDGGDVNVIAYEGSTAGSGKIHLPTSFAFDVGSFANGTGTNGDLSIIAGSDAIDAITMGGANARGGSTDGTGSIYISTSTPGSATLSTSANFAGISSGSFRGGAIRPNAGVDIGRTLVSSDAQVTLESGAGGVHFGDVSLFGNFQVNSLGDITVYGNTAVISGAGDNSNTLLWTALGNISLCTRIILHATGGGTAYVGGGGGVALIASGTVQTINSPIGGFQDASIETSSGYNAGNITVVAGADFTRVGNTVTINGSSGSGGSILFDGTAVGGFTGRLITHVDAHSQGGTDPAYLDGGNVTLISFNDLKLNPGVSDFFSAAGGSFFPPATNGTNGNVTIVSPGIIVLPKIDMAANRGGSVTIRGANPGVVTGLDVTPMAFGSFGNVNSGSFLTGGLASTGLNFTTVLNGVPASTNLNLASQGDVTVGNIDLHSSTAGVTGGNVVIESGGNVSLGTIDVSNTSASGGAGIISITANSATTLDIGGVGANKTGALTANASGTAGNGSEIHLINNGSGGIKLTTVPSQTVTNGDGATLELDAGTGTLDVGGLGFNISRNAAGANHNGGEISLTYGSLTGGAGTIVLTANGTGTGSGGIVSVHTTASGAAGDIVIGANPNQFSVQASGGGGSIILNAGGALTLTNAGNVNTADNVFLSAVNGITISNTINTKDVRLSAGGPIVVNSQIFADPITMVSASDISLGSDLIANGGILIVSGGNITTTASIAIDGSNFSGPGGNIFFTAGAAFTETANDVTITGPSATGGSLNLTNAGGVNLFSASSFDGASSAGDITMLAYKGSGGASGQIAIPSGTSINATVNLGNGAGGDITFIGGSAGGGNAVSIGNVSSSNGAGQFTTGPVNIYAAQPDATSVSAISKSDASYTGSFLGGTLTNGNISVGAITTKFADIFIHTNGSITAGNLTANAIFGGGNASGARIDIITGSAGALTLGSMNADGTGFGNGGNIFVLGGNGGTIVGSSSAKGGATLGAGGSVSITVDTATSYSAGSIDVRGFGAGAGGGQVSVSNLGTGGIDLSGNSIALNGSGIGGQLTIDAGPGPITCTGVFLADTSGGSGFNNGNISLSATNITILGNLILSSDLGVAGSGNISITTSSGDLVTGASGVSIHSGNDVNLSINGKIDDRAAIPGPVTIVAAGDINGSGTNIDTSSISGTNSGANIILQAGGSVSIGSLTALPNGAVNGGFITISSGAGGVNFSNITTAADAIVNISATNGSVTGTSITAPSQTVDALSLVLNGVSPGDFTLSGVSNIGRFKGQGGGLVTIDNGANAMVIEDVGTSQSLAFTTTNAATGFTSGSNGWTTTGTVLLNTPRFQLGQSWSAASFTIQNTLGSLVLSGTSGALFGSTPPAGSPGDPSSPTAIIFNTANGANLDLFGTMTFSGDVSLNNTGGITTSANNSLFAGNNNVILRTLTWTQTGNGNITGNDLILSGLTLVNSDANVVLSGNSIYHGRDLAIIAKGNVDLGNFTIDLSSSTGNAGDLTVIAGYDFSPSSGGQKFDAQPYTLTGPSVAGGSILGTATIVTSTTSATGDSGAVFAIASNGTTNAGSISLGNISTSSVNGAGGSVFIVAPAGVTIGNVSSTGQTAAGDVTLSVGVPLVLGTPGPIIIQEGVFSGGIVGIDSVSTGTLNVGSINTGNGAISLSSAGPTININGGLTAHNILIDASKTGQVNLSTTNTITAQQDVVGNGGTIDITAGDVSTTGGATLVLQAQGTGIGSGGAVLYRTASSLNVSTGGDLTVDTSAPGAGNLVDIRSDNDITIDAGGISAVGADGSGTRLILTAGFDGSGSLTLNNTNFLNAASAHGTNGDGGEVRLSSPNMFFASTSGAPLQLHADGVGTGAGGLVQFTNSDTANTVFGVPAKTPKGTSNFLSISAKSGTLGNGGTIIVDVGGNITVADTSQLDASPQGGGSSGASYTLRAHNLTGKAGNIIISGDIDSDGITGGLAGEIVIRSDTKNDFVANSGSKTPKNGITGTLSANGTNGSIDVGNDGGGVNIATSGALTAPSLLLRSALKGAISAGSGVTISGSNFIAFFSENGSIGKKPITISTPDVSFTTTTGSVNLNDSLNAQVAISGTAGGDISFTTAAALDVGSTSTTNGSIFMTAGSGALHVLNSADIDATNGGITIASLNVNTGTVLIDDNAQVKTGGKGDQVVIAIGAPPKKGTNPSPPDPTGVVPQHTGKGQIFYGPAGGVVVVPTGTSNVQAINKNVIFNNLSSSIATNKITLGDNTLIKADPPTRTIFGTPANPAAQSLQSELQQPTVLNLLPTPPQGNFDASLINLTNINRVDLAGITIADTMNSAQGDREGSTTSGLNDLIVKAAFHSDLDAGQQEFAIENQSGIKLSSAEVPVSIRSKNLKLAAGNVVFAPSSDTTIETAHGTVKLAGGSIALVMQSNSGLSVYDLHDKGKNDVVIETNGKRISLTPGRHVMVSHHSTRDFSDVNPIELVQYRGLSQSKLGNGWNVYTSEFSIPSACYAVKPLNQLMKSKHAEANKMAKRITKNTAILMTLNPDRGDFVQFFKSAITAMHK